MPMLTERSMHMETTGEFKRSWESIVSNTSRAVTGFIFQDYNVMTYDPEDAIHGDIYTGDQRENIARALNEGYTSIFGAGWWEKPRGYWDIAFKVVQDGTLDRWIVESFRHNGINIIKK